MGTMMSVWSGAASPDGSSGPVLVTMTSRGNPPQAAILFGDVHREKPVRPSSSSLARDDPRLPTLDVGVIPCEKPRSASGTFGVHRCIVEFPCSFTSPCLSVKERVKRYSSPVQEKSKKRWLLSVRERGFLFFSLL